MNSRALLMSAFVGILITVWVFYLYRKNRIKEDHALLWIFISVSITTISLRSDILMKINILIDAQNPTSLIFSIFIGFLIMICIYFSVKISELSEQNKRLAQEISLVKLMETMARKRIYRKDD